MRCIYGVRDAKELWNEYRSTFPEPDNGLNKKPLSHFLKLENNLSRHFETRYSSLSREVDGIARVAYDISGKPPATIEWE